ncbi:hypothetical protein AVEN_204529-1 [Araneus ventricosus]|uniref:Uncharacterized protein n=1 Tax=Araneus ventricosus TaxID=182803 RepID=A0A4Y2HQI1_ARAVE|nr:hypothetical protein AVEN_204529-1 [Araneus ventricosus]
MESRFPAKLVLWLGRDFYSGMYGNAREMESWTPEHGNHFDDFGYEMWDLKSTGIFLILLLGAYILINPVGLRVERRRHLQSVCLQGVVSEDQTDENRLGLSLVIQCYSIHLTAQT